MPPKQKSKSRLDTEQPIKGWEQGLQLATFSEEVYFLSVVFTIFVDWLHILGIVLWWRGEAWIGA